MKYAKSMYRGGEIIDAEQSISYKDYKELGLICPFCNAAVFYRSGSIQSRIDKNEQTAQVTIPPSFCHFKEKNPECELRAKRADGINYIDQLKAEAKGQRLELFNKHLWKIISDYLPFPYKRIKTTVNFDRSLLAEVYKQMRISLLAEKQVFADIKEAFFDNDPINPNNISKFAEFTAEQKEAKTKIFNAIDKQLQVKIVQEIMQFLITKSGNYTYERMIKISLVDLASDYYRNEYDINPDFVLVNTIMDSVCRITLRQDPKPLICSFIMILCNINWIYYLYELKNDKKDRTITKKS